MFFKDGLIRKNILFKPETVGEGQFDLPCGFSKNVFSKERVKPCGVFFIFNIIIRHIFPENFNEIAQVVRKL